MSRGVLPVRGRLLELADGMTGGGESAVGAGLLVAVAGLFGQH
jgi:hypothetical protein